MLFLWNMLDFVQLLWSVAKDLCYQEIGELDI